MTFCQVRRIVAGLGGMQEYARNCYYIIPRWCPGDQASQPERLRNGHFKFRKAAFTRSISFNTSVFSASACNFQILCPVFLSSILPMLPGLTGASLTLRLSTCVPTPMVAIVSRGDKRNKGLPWLPSVFLGKWRKFTNRYKQRNDLNH